MSIDNKVRWNRSKVLSYNKLFSFIIGARSIGKTYDCKKWAIDDWVRKGKKTAWVMRYRTEIDEIVKGNKFFEDISRAYPDYQFKIEGNLGQLRKMIDGIDPKEIAWDTFMSFKALSESSLKAISDPDVNKVIFDEFIPLPGIRYLSNEVERFLEYFFTIARDRDIRAIFLGNNVSVVSPYFTYFKVKMPKEGEFAVYDEIVIENCKNEAFKEQMRSTRFGRLVKGTNYANYAIENQSLVDLNSFVMDRPKNSRCAVRIDSQMGTMYLWTARPASLFVSLVGNPNCTCWAVDEASHGEGKERVDFAGTFAMTLIKKHYRMGSLFFDSAEVKATFMAVCGRFIK